MTARESFPRVGVGAIVWRGGDVLLIKRATMPRAGEWSLPGGRQELGETVAQALMREVREETGVEIALLGLVDVVDAIVPPADGMAGHHYTLIDFSARYVSGTARAGSDAAEIAWAPFGALERYPMWSQTRRVVALSARLHGPLAAP